MYMKVDKLLVLTVLMAFGLVFGAFAKDISSAEAVQLSQSVIDIAQKQGYKVSVTVIDSQGGVLATIRADGAFGHTPKTSYKKANTALIAKETTLSLVNRFTSNGSADMTKFIVANLNGSDNIVILGGGLPLYENGELIGAIGIGGAPGGHLDEAIALEAMKKAGYTAAEK
jgi:uncharacterized protein GlcG (DUF336 family)